MIELHVASETDDASDIEAAFIELDAYLTELPATIALWRKYQSDACCIEDDGSIC